MGLFSGRDEGLYRGDAPVSFSDSSGGAPTPYDTAGADAHARQHATHWRRLDYTPEHKSPAR